MCSVCLEDLDAGVPLECGHAFHYECIVEWLRHGSTCPVCRSPVAERGRDAVPLLVHPRRPSSLWVTRLSRRTNDLT